jgi:hypothetical protein
MPGRIGLGANYADFRKGGGFISFAAQKPLHTGIYLHSESKGGKAFFAGR